MFADHLTHIVRMQAQLINRQRIPDHRRYRGRFGMVHQTFDNKFEERLHKPVISNYQAAAAAVLASFFKKLETVSLGSAPLLIQ